MFFFTQPSARVTSMDLRGPGVTRRQSVVRDDGDPAAPHELVQHRSTLLALVAHHPRAPVDEEHDRRVQRRRRHAPHVESLTSGSGRRRRSSRSCMSRGWKGNCSAVRHHDPKTSSRGRPMRQAANGAPRHRSTDDSARIERDAIRARFSTIDDRERQHDDAQPRRSSATPTTRAGRAAPSRSTIPWTGNSPAAQPTGYARTAERPSTTRSQRRRRREDEERAH